VGSRPCLRGVGVFASVVGARLYVMRGLGVYVGLGICWGLGGGWFCVVGCRSWLWK